MTKFTELGLSRLTVLALKEFGYTQPTEIQEKTIPLILSGRDLMASAQTGSGKTAAFALPIIECLQEPEKKPRALVLVPTRELAVQVEEQFEGLAKNYALRSVTLYGGIGYDKQIRSLTRGVDVVVATPGRLLDHVERRTVDLSAVEHLVLDEADRMLDMGFMPQVRKVIAKLSKDRQTLMFSATIDPRVQRIAADFLIDPVVVKVNTQQIEPLEIEQRVHRVNEFGKDALLAQLIKESAMSTVLVFTRTRRKAAWVKNRLQEAGILVEEIHSDINQSQREKTLTRFRQGEFAVLVATDIAARGLDVPSISHVINYDLPDSAEDYVHRIGRTGRAGRSGIALSFVSQEQSHLLKDIEKMTGKQLDPSASDRKAAVPRRFRTTGRRRRII